MTVNLFALILARGKFQKSLPCTLLLMVALSLTVFGQRPEPVDPSTIIAFKPDQHSIRGFVTRVYRAQEAEVQKLCKLEENELPAGISLKKNGAVLEVKKLNRPDLIMIDKPLFNLVSFFDINQDAEGYHKSRLLALGFPLDEMALLERARLPEHALAQFKKQAYTSLFTEHEHVVDATLEATDAEITAYFRVFRKADREARMAWAIATLEQFSPFSVEILFHFFEEDNDTNYQHYWTYNQEAIIKIIRNQRYRIRHPLTWPGGTGPRPIAPPPYLLTEAGEPFWVRASAVSLDPNDQPLLIDKGLQQNPFSHDVKQSIGRRFTLLTKERAKYKAGTLPECPLTWPQYMFLDWKFEQLFPRSEAIYLGIIREITPGFERGTPSSLLTVQIERWLRKPGPAVEQVYYIYYPNIRFDVGHLRFCAEDKRFFKHPFIGQRLLGFSTSRPKSAGRLLLYVGPANLFAENKSGNVEGFSLRPTEAGSFDAFVEKVTALETMWPFYKYIIGEIK